MQFGLSLIQFWEQSIYSQFNSPFREEEISLRNERLTTVT